MWDRLGTVRRWSRHGLGLGVGLAGLAMLSGCDRGQSSDGSPRSESGAHQPPDPRQWFTEITNEVGLDFVHETGAAGDFLLPEIMASGAALFDYDNDGDLDIYLTNGNHTLPDGRRAQAPVNRMYRQEADGRFVDVTAQSGLGDGGYGMGVAIGDIDNDGDADVFVTNYGRDRLYRNRGDGTFEDITDAAGITVDDWSSSAVFFDYDRDGFLDLFVARYVTYDPPQGCVDHAGRPDYCGPDSFPPLHDVLLRNNGDGTFADVSEVAGMTSAAAAGLGVICEDLNDDGWIDVYVANDGDANHLWMNQHDGTFIDAALLLGTAVNLHGVPEAGMGIVAADFDNDTDLDLFITHVVYETNTLYRNRGGETGFEDISGQSGLGGSSLPYTGFGTAAFDVELDGDHDLLVVGGGVERAEPYPDVKVDPPWDTFAEPNLFYLNDGRGHFELLNDVVASVCAPIEVSRGLAVGDIDRDGDLDLLVTNAQGPARLYRNDTPRLGSWLIVRAMDPALNRDAIGARVTVVAGEQVYVRTISRGFSYLSASDPRAHFGLGEASAVDTIEVWWPDGQRERFSGTPANRVIELVRGTGEFLK